MKAIKTSTKAQRRADKALIRDAAANKGAARRQLLARLLGTRLDGDKPRPGDTIDVALPTGTRTMVVCEGGRVVPLDDGDPEYRPIVVSARQAADLMRLGITDGYVVAEMVDLVERMPLTIDLSSLSEPAAGHPDYVEVEG